MPDYATKDPSNLLLGQPDGTFVEGADAAGILSFAKGRGAALADFNLDGLLDLVEVNYGDPVKLWRNVGSGDAATPKAMGHWAALQVTQPGPNRDAIGAWIEVQVGDRRSGARSTIGGGHESGELGWIHVGLGSERLRQRPGPVAGRRVGPVADGPGRRLQHDRARRDRGPTLAATDTLSAGGTPMPTPRLREVRVPDFGMPEAMPVIPASTYAGRLDELRSRADARGYDRIVVYADREHSANLSFLTGFDPRFEEALLIVGAGGQPLILVGNECFGMAGAAPLPMRRELFQDLSLPSQPRDRSRPLGEILAGEGIGAGSRVGVVGWKTYASRATIEVPAYLVDALRELTGASGLVENANDLLIDPADGLRIVNDVDQLAAFEYAACQTSDGVRRLLAGLRPGLRESEAVRLLALERDAAVVPPHADRRAHEPRSDCSARSTGRSSAATRSRSPSGSGAG